VDEAEPDVLSYDVARYECGPVARAAIRRLLRRDGRVMWGVAEPGADEDEPHVAGRGRAAASAVATEHGQIDGVWRASLLSGSCGTGGVDVDVEAERRLARTLRITAAVLRGEPAPALEPEAPAVVKVP
jgi:hypothetical protein